VAAHFLQTRHSIQFVTRGEQAQLRCQARGDWPLLLHWLKNGRLRLEPTNVLETQTGAAPMSSSVTAASSAAGEQQQTALFPLWSLASSLVAVPLGSSTNAGEQQAAGNWWWWQPSSLEQPGEQAKQAGGALLQRYSLATSEHLVPAGAPAGGRSSGELAELAASLRARRRLQLASARAQQQQRSGTGSAPVEEQQVVGGEQSGGGNGGAISEESRAPLQEGAERAALVVQVSSVLSIQQAERQDGGTFKCVAANKFGLDERTVQLVVQEPPDKIEELSVLEVSSRSVTLGWLVPFDGNSPIARYHVHYRPAAGPAAKLAASQQLLASLEPLPLSSNHLQQQQTGGQLDKQAASFAELAWFNHTLLVGSGDSSGASGSLDAQQATSGGSTGTGSGPGGRKTEAVGQQTSGSSSMGAQGAPMSSLVRVSVSSLRPITRYWFRVEPENALGRGPISGLVEALTREEAPASAPSKLKAIAQSSSSILVSWARLSERDSLGSVQGYYVAYRPLQEPLGAAASSQTATNSSQPSGELAGQSLAPPQSIYKTVPNDEKLAKLDALLTGLRRHTRYMVTVQAFNGRGTGPASEPLLVQTLELDPPRQLRLFVRRASNCSIELEWRPHSQAALARLQQEQRTQQQQQQLPQLSQSQQQESKRPELSATSPPGSGLTATGNGNSNGNINVNSNTNADVVDYYSLYRAELNEQPQWQEFRLAGHATSHLAEGLQCGTRYQFYMMGVNRVGMGEQSDILDTRTSGGTPLAPDRQSTFEVVNSTCYVIRLDNWQDNGCPIRRFNVRYRLESARDWLQLAHLDVSALDQRQAQANGSSSPAESSRSGSGPGEQQTLELRATSQPEAPRGASLRGQPDGTNQLAGLVFGEPELEELASSARAQADRQMDVAADFVDAPAEAQEPRAPPPSGEPNLDPLQEDDSLVDYPLGAAGTLETGQAENMSADYLALEAAALISKDSPQLTPSANLEHLSDGASPDAPGATSGAENRWRRAGPSDQQLFSLLRDSMLPAGFEADDFLQTRLERHAYPAAQFSGAASGSELGQRRDDQDREQLARMPPEAHQWQASNFVLESSAGDESAAAARARPAPSSGGGPRGGAAPVSAAGASAGNAPEVGGADWRRIKLCNMAPDVYYIVQIRAANRVGETEAELRILNNQEGLEYDPLLGRQVVGRLGGRNNPPPGQPADRTMAHPMGGGGVFALDHWPYLVPTTLGLSLVTVVVIMALLLGAKSPAGSPAGSTSSAATGSSNASSNASSSATCSAGLSLGGRSLQGGVSGGGGGSGEPNGAASNCSSSGYLDDMTPLSQSTGAASQPPSHQHHQHHFATLHLPGHAATSHCAARHLSMGTLKPHHLQHYHLQQQQLQSSQSGQSSGQETLGQRHGPPAAQQRDPTGLPQDTYATIGPARACLVGGPIQQQQQAAGGEQAGLSNGLSSPSFTETNLASIYQQRSGGAGPNQQCFHEHQMQQTSAGAAYAFIGSPGCGGAADLLGANQADCSASQLMAAGQNATLLDSNGNSLAEQSHSSTNQTGSSPTTSGPLSSLNSNGGAQLNQQQQQCDFSATLPHHFGQAHNQHHHFHHENHQPNSRGLNVYLCSPKDSDASNKEQEAKIFYAQLNSNIQQQLGLHNQPPESSFVGQVLRGQPLPQQTIAEESTGNNGTNLANAQDSAERFPFDPVYATIRRTFPQVFKYKTLAHNPNHGHTNDNNHSHRQPDDFFHPPNS